MRRCWRRPGWRPGWGTGWCRPGLPLKLVHGHEFIFGFAAAIIFGVVITALPSWAGTEEIDGGRLKLLVALWLAGRFGFWAAPWLPAPLPALLDCLLYATAIAMLAPQLLRVKNRLYLLLLPILAALFIANLVYHQAAVRGDAALAGLALRGAIWAIVVLYVLKGGVLAPIFTGNALREKDRGAQPPFLMPLEAAALIALLALAACDLGSAPPAWSGGAALACLLLYGWRSARWQGWRVADVPLLLPMHLGFAWLLLAFALKAVADLGGALPESAWLHAFTVGSLGLMMLGLMTRVSQRHTGRPLAMPWADDGRLRRDVPRRRIARGRRSRRWQHGDDRAGHPALGCALCHLPGSLCADAAGAQPAARQRATMNVALLLSRAARRHAERPALAVGTHVVASYAEFAARVARLAGGLAARLAPGDRVGLVMKNCPAYAEAMFACWHAGLVAVPINAKLHPKELEYILGHSGCRLCFATPDLFPRWPGWRCRA